MLTFDSTKKIHLTLIRHAKVDGPSALYGSRTNVRCRPDELKQIVPVTRKFDRIIISPLQRTIETACKLFYPQLQFEPEPDTQDLELDSRAREFDFGILDGKPFESYSDEDSHLLELFNNSKESCSLPDGERLDHFSQRIEELLFSILASTADHKHVALVTHGGVIAQILSLVLNIPLRKLLYTMSPEYLKATTIEFTIPVDSTTSSLMSSQNYFARIICVNSPVQPT